MKSFKLIIQILLMATLVAGIAACDKGGKKGNVSRAVRNFNNGTGGPAPTGGGGSQWGEITNFSRPALLAFAGLQEGEIGEVSAYSNQQTGVRFYGQIDQYGRGYLSVSIFDSFYLQNPSIGPFEPPVPYTCQGQSAGGGNLILNCSGGLQPLTLQGYETQNGEFIGQITFGGNNSLGQFRISSCGFLGC